jgi:hypothetical protein
MAEPHKRRRHSKFRQKFRVRNWAEYEKSLRDRGDITIWVTPEGVAAWTPSTNGKRGAQEVYSDLAIETALTLRLLFHLPLRQTEGFLRSILKLMGLDLPCPDHTTLSRRNQSVEMAKQLSSGPSGPVSFIVDSTGLKVCGQGEWHTKKHGRKQRRKWMKLHVGVDDHGWILASKITDGHEQDPGQVPDLLNQFEGAIETFVADGIYDQAGVYDSVQAHSPEVIIVIPPRKNSIISGAHQGSKTQRDCHIERIQDKGHFKWKRISGYYKQSHVENTFSRYKQIFGGRLHAKRRNSQKKEIKIATGILNKMISLGSPDSYPVT